jgi:predicted nuclease of predicted toxin-antitoxin system
MKVLLDENMPHQLRSYLPSHEVSTAVYAGFGGFKNGELLKAAEDAGYDVLLTGDLSLEYQQNMVGRKIAIISLSANSWRIVQNHIPAIALAIDTAQSGFFSRVDCGKYVASKKPGGPHLNK